MFIHACKISVNVAKWLLKELKSVTEIVGRARFPAASNRLGVYCFLKVSVENERCGSSTQCGGQCGVLHSVWWAGWGPPLSVVGRGRLESKTLSSFLCLVAKATG